MYKLDELKTIYNAIDDKLGTDIVILDISEISTLTTYFIIASASNVRQVEAICDNIQEEIKKQNPDAKFLKEGMGTNWALVDLGYAYIHVFHEDSRDEYNLERLWADAKVIDITKL